MSDTFQIRVNEKAHNVILPNGYMYQGGELAFLTQQIIGKVNPILLTNEYKDSGQPLLIVEAVPQDSDFKLRGWHPPAPRSDGRTIDIAYPLKPEHGSYEEFRLSLRSLGNLAGAGTVYVAEGRPEWINPETVVYLPTQAFGEKFKGIGASLKAVVNSDISEDFVWMNDDILFLWPDSYAGLFARKTKLDAFVEGIRPKTDPVHMAWIKGMKSQRDILRAWGHDTKHTPCLDSHTPILLNKTRVKEMIARVEEEFPMHVIGHFRSLYYHYATTPVFDMSDPKRRTNSINSTRDLYYSFSEDSWIEEGWRARLCFRESSPYEQ